MIAPDQDTALAPASLKTAAPNGKNRQGEDREAEAPNWEGEAPAEPPRSIGSAGASPSQSSPSQQQSSRPFVQEIRDLGIAFRRWPLPTQVTILALFLLYIPVIYEVSRMWLRDESFAHGVFIIPVCLFILWLNRSGIRDARANPVAWGLVPLIFGLALETFSYLVQVKLLAMFSLIPTVIGAILVLHGRAMWRRVRFSVGFLFFAVPLPDFVTGPISNWIQHASSTGATLLMKAVGYSIIQTGNIIEIPGHTLEVAEVCSGFKKLVALAAFSLLYGYMFQIRPWKQMVLFAAAIPVALVANVIRIAALIALTSTWGERALHIAHDWAEIFVLVVAFFLFVLLGKALGCKKLRFSL